jgi:hypothetical protein
VQPGVSLAELAAIAPPPPLYLVKWYGLGYAEATWETGPDVGDDDAIRAFRLREAPPDALVNVMRLARAARLHSQAWLDGAQRPQPSLSTALERAGVPAAAVAAAAMSNGKVPSMTAVSRPEVRVIMVTRPDSHRVEVDGTAQQPARHSSHRIR